jgi:type II secretory pathway component PulK
MVDALLDWRDADDIPCPLGAERDWYRDARRFPPRNGPLADVRELRRVRGFDESTIPDSVLDAVFTTEPGRILWTRAPLAVLASIPGLDEETLARMAERRSMRADVSTATDLSGGLSPSSRHMMEAQRPEIQGLTTDRPDAWIVTARGRPGTIEVRLAPAGARAAIVRRRTTP